MDEKLTRANFGYEMWQCSYIFLPTLPPLSAYIFSPFPPLCHYHCAPLLHICKFFSHAHVDLALPTQRRRRLQLPLLAVLPLLSPPTAGGYASEVCRTHPAPKVQLAVRPSPTTTTSRSPPNSAWIAAGIMTTPLLGTPSSSIVSRWSSPGTRRMGWLPWTTTRSADDYVGVVGSSRV
jgi:hypothetical protein